MARTSRAIASPTVKSDTVADADADASMFQSLRAYPAFRHLWTGTLATNSAFWMYQIAVGWLALQMTDSPFFVGLTGFAGGIPILIFALPSGVIVDKFDRRTILLSAQVGVMIVALAFAVLVATDLIERWSILALAFAYGTVMSFIFPTRNAVVPSLVARADLANAVALNAAGQNSTRVVGPSLAGALIALIGTAGTFGVAASLQILALFWTLRLPSDKSPVGIKVSLWDSLTIGLRIVARDRFLTGLILLATISTVFVMPYINLMPVFARDELGLGSTGLGLLMAATGTGSVSGALLVARWRGLARVRSVQIASAAAFALLVILFALAPSVVIAAPLLFCAGVLSAAYMAINQTVLQLQVADEVRGRVLSIYLLTWGMLPLGQLPLGALADRVGAPEATIIACGVAIALTGLLATRFPQLRA